MHPRLSRGLVLLAAGAVLTGAGLTGQAVAQPPDGGGVCAAQPSSWVAVCAQDKKSQDGASASSGSTGKPSGKKQGRAQAPGPCVVQKMSPQPAAGSALWEGHKPGDGAVYTRKSPDA